MQIGDLVRHAVHSGALGIIVEIAYYRLEYKVHWTNNSWGEKWELTQNFEVIDESR